MKRIAFFLFASILFCSMLAAQDKSATEPTGKKYAVLVGVNDYVRLRNLQYTKNDIEALRDELYKIGFEKNNVYCLVSGAAAAKDLPTKENIEVVIETVLNMAKAGDTVIVAMSGHGVEVGGQARFCPPDTKDDIASLENTTVAIGDIFANFEQCKATMKLMIIDACRNNPFRSKDVAGAKSLGTLDDVPEGMLLLQSCKKGELSYEDEDLKQGVFTHYLVEGLRGEAANKKGEVTLLGLASYTIEQTQRHALDQFRARQQPYLKGEITDFVLVEKVKLTTTLTVIVKEPNSAVPKYVYYGDRHNNHSIPTPVHVVPRHVYCRPSFPLLPLWYHTMGVGYCPFYYSPGYYYAGWRPAYAPVYPWWIVGGVSVGVGVYVPPRTSYYYPETIVSYPATTVNLIVLNDEEVPLAPPITRKQIDVVWTNMQNADGFFAANKLEEAMTTYQKIADEIPQMPDPWVRMTIGCVAQGDYNSAMDACNRAIILSTGWPCSPLSLDYMYQQNARQKAEDLALLDATAAMHPDNSDLAFLTGMMYYFDGQSAKAGSYLGKAKKLMPDLADFVDPMLANLAAAQK